MRCPKCGYISFDYLDSCKKCSSDISNVRNLVGLIAVQAAGGVLLESTGPMALAESAADFEFSEGGQEDMRFQFEGGSEDSMSAEARQGEMDLNMEEDPIFDLSEEEEEVQEIQLDLSEMEEELSFEPQLDLTSSDQGLGDMEFELDLPLGETSLDDKFDLVGNGDLANAGVVGGAGEDALDGFTLEEDELLNLDLESDETMEPFGADMAGQESEPPMASLDESGIDDAGLDLSELELESDLSLGEPLTRPQPMDAEPTGEIDMGDLKDLSLEQEFEAASGPYDLDDSETDSAEILGLDALEGQFDDLTLDADNAEAQAEDAVGDDMPKLSMENETLDLSMEETPEPAELGLHDAETEGMLDVDDLESALADMDNAPAPLGPQEQIFADSGAEEIDEELSLEELSQDEIFRSTDGEVPEEAKDEAPPISLDADEELELVSLDGEGDEAILELDDSDESDLDALAKDFEEGLTDLELESDLDLNDDEIFAAIPEKDPLKPE